MKTRDDSFDASPNDASPRDDDKPLQPTLARATATLRTALGQACGADIERIDTGELIRIEEVLAIANEAAKEAISVRRRLRSTPGQAAGSRELDGPDGARWTVFAVHPSNRGGRPTVRDHYRAGWLTFDSGSETRRLAPIPENWRELPDDELWVLCTNAEPSDRRTKER